MIHKKLPKTSHVSSWADAKPSRRVWLRGRPFSS